eukprot:5399629-Ditylum_brightwellii.AAC.1
MTKTAQTLAGGEQVTFIYTEPFVNLNHTKHAIDDNDNIQHDPILFEESWSTEWWPNKNMAWYLTVTKVSSCLAKAHTNGVDAEPWI